MLARLVLCTTVAVAITGCSCNEPKLVERPTPQIQPVLREVNFGDVYVGESAQEVVTLANVGSAPLTVGSVSVSVSPPFTVGNGEQTIILPSSEVDIFIEFHPVKGGLVSGLMVIESDSQENPKLTVGVRGRGLEPCGGPCAQAPSSCHVAPGTCSNNTQCVYVEIVATAGGDGCCPKDATVAEDSDCPTRCGDGVVSSQETCDIAIASGQGACATACDDGNACTMDRLEGVGCQAFWFNSQITEAISGDGCCPAGANVFTDSDCQVNVGTPFPISQRQGSEMIPRVAGGDNQFLVAWSISSDRIYSRVVDRTLGPQGPANGIETIGPTHDLASVAFDGSGYAVLGGRHGSILQRVSSGGTLAGAPIDLDGVLGGGGGYGNVGFGAGNYLATWYRGGAAGVYGRLVDPGGAVVSFPFEINPTGFPQSGFTGVASDGTDYAVTYYRSGQSQDVFMRIVGGTLSGPPPNAAPAFISSEIPLGTGPLDQTDTDIAFGGGTYMAVWEDSRQVNPPDLWEGARGRVVDTSGNPMGSADLVFHSPDYYSVLPQVTWDGKSFFVVWQNNAQGKPTQIIGQLVNPDGTLKSAPFIIATLPPQSMGHPDVAASNGRVLVVWAQNQLGGDIWGVYIDPP